MDIDIKNRDGHYEIYVNGQFHSSEDTMEDVTKELRNIDETVKGEER